MTGNTGKISFINLNNISSYFNFENSILLKKI